MASERDQIHDDLAAYVMGHLGVAERARFEDHIGHCAACREEVESLGPLAVALENMSEPFEVPPDLRAGVLEAVDVAAASDFSADGAAPRRAPAERRPFFSGLARRGGFALAGLAVLAVAVFVGLQIGDEGDEAPVLSGPVEVDAMLRSASGAPEGDLLVTAFPTGRQIEFSSEELPILPTGDYYELWFVAPGDTPTDPNRVSAGTFHPDEEGITDVVLHAAVDPALFTRVEVTSEPGDGDPAPSGEVVAELPSEDFLPSD